MTEDRTAIVTGAARNIGRGVVLELARRGYGLVVNARTDSEELHRTVADARALGGHAVAAPGDVADPATAGQLLSVAESNFGRADILVHVPAIRPVQPFLETTHDDWSEVFATNLDGLFHACQAVIPGMLERRWGRIIGFSGAKAFRGHRIGAHVAASKAAVVGMLRGLAYEFGESGITANIVVPGPFDTERAEAVELGSGRRFAVAGTPTGPTLPPVGRLGRPEEVGHLCAYLASDDAGYVTGQSLHINGGVDFY